MNHKSGLITFLLILFGCKLFAQVIVADKTSICDSANVLFSLSPPVAVGTTISWDFGNGSSVSGDLAPSVLFNVPGIYTVSCVLNNITTINSTNLINVFKSPSSNFNYKDSLAIDEYSFVFSHLRSPSDIGVLNLDWQFSDGGSGSTSPLLYSFPAPGEYITRLIVTDSNGCSDTTDRLVGIANLLEAPNVFTPNDDAINDFFEVRTNGVNTYIFSVYSRSGVLVFRSESPIILWDGRSFSGQILTPGLYYYTIEQKESGPLNIKNGSIYLFK